MIVPEFEKAKNLFIYDTAHNNLIRSARNAEFDFTDVDIAVAGSTLFTFKKGPRVFQVIENPTTDNPIVHKDDLPALKDQLDLSLFAVCVMFDRFVVLTGGLNKKMQTKGSMIVFDTKKKAWQAKYPAK